MSLYIISYVNCCLTDTILIILPVKLVFSDIGAHVDGFPAVAGHTFVIGASADNKITGRRADVMMAANYASQVAIRLLKPGGDVGFSLFKLALIYYRIFNKLFCFFTICS